MEENNLEQNDVLKVDCEQSQKVEFSRRFSILLGFSIFQSGFTGIIGAPWYLDGMYLLAGMLFVLLSEIIRYGAVYQKEIDTLI
ncbi:hypothetical protein [Extibacter muris]|uniref:DUF2975 domain-containing protein n=1 Tax=Extibacter muris TaxID=1796622 RepID=A0A4R4FDI0_9FIRM|nr:hypothetical protein [Extibacter muris]MCU0079464.1 hypothetical protein [Extibacter muris]TDA20809.1 hypothetical protein E1963_15250 [Extibacter muris]